jgi:hypothetical protein
LRNHAKPSIYTMKDSYKFYLASSTSIPLSIFHHEVNELEFQEMVVILSPLSLYGGNRKTKLLLLHNRRHTHPRRALWDIVVIAPSEGWASTASLHSTNATLAIMLCVLRFEASRHPRPQIGQTSFNSPSDRFRPDNHAESSVLALWLTQVT